MDFKKLFRADNTFQDSVPKEMTRNIMSGHEYHKLCKWSLCTRYPIHFDNELIGEDDLVFIQGGLDYLDDIKWMLWENPPSNKFRAVIHNTDESYTLKHHTMLSHLVSHTFTINNYLHDEEDVTPIPLGFNDTTAGVIDRNPHFQYIFDNEKTKLCLVKFWRNFMRPGRSECYAYFDNNCSFADCETENQWIDILGFYDQLRSYKYAVCPTGAGLDTHRFWECLLLNVIPIVKINPITPFLSNFPCLIVEDWSEVTEEYLNDMWEPLYEDILVFKDENPNWFLSKNYVK